MYSFTKNQFFHFLIIGKNKVKKNHKNMLQYFDSDVSMSSYVFMKIMFPINVCNHYRYLFIHILNGQSIITLYGYYQGF